MVRKRRCRWAEGGAGTAAGEQGYVLIDGGRATTWRAHWPTGSTCTGGVGRVAVGSGAGCGGDAGGAAGFGSAARTKAMTAIKILGKQALLFATFPLTGYRSSAGASHIFTSRFPEQTREMCVNFCVNYSQLLIRRVHERSSW